MLEVRKGSPRQVLPLLSQDESLVSWLLDDVVDSIEMGSPWQDLHPHRLASKASVSAVGLQGDERLVPVAGLAPARDRF